MSGAGAPQALVYAYTVLACERRRALTSAQKLADGTVRQLFTDLGWFVTVRAVAPATAPALSFGTGTDDPGFRAGMMIDLVLRPRKDQADG
jgi:hypothetical protein